MAKCRNRECDYDASYCYRCTKDAVEKARSYGWQDIISWGAENQILDSSQVAALHMLIRNRISGK